MKELMITILLSLSFIQAGELEKDIRYLGNNGKTTTHEVVCKNGKKGVVSIDNATHEMSVGSQNLGKVTFSVAIEKICN